MNNLAMVMIGIILLLALLMIIPRVMMSLKIEKLKGNDAPTPHKASEQWIKSGNKTVLYFYTPACSACKIIEPIIEKITKAHDKSVFKIDASVNVDSATAYGVLGVPFIVFIDKGKVVSAKAGVQQESVFASFFES